MPVVEADRGLFVFFEVSSSSSRRWLARVATRMQERVRARVRVEVEEVARHPPWPVEEAPRVVEYNRQMILAR